MNYNENTFNNLKGDILFFDTEIEFNDQNLSKLSCSIDYNISSLFVSPSDGGSNKLTIKGLLFNQEFNNIFLNGITHFSGLTGNYKPDLLIINSFLPGVLELNRGMYKLGKLEKGKFVYETQPANHTSFMGEYIKRIFDDSEKLYRRFDCLIEYFLNEVSSRCSGAGVLFVPAELREQVSKDFEINYGIEKDNLRIKSLLDTLSEFNEHLKTDRMESDHFLNILQNINKYVAQRLNFIAQLANIDGALVLTNEFEVIGYGVKLNSKPWKRDVITGPNSADKGGEVFDYKSLGTRHSSMIDVIGYYENCIGYVFSQDGPIRGFVKKNKDTILCWPDCSLTFINY
ncbi:MAG: hypothetical protein GTO02_06485 [Candidatus Dadabacteria bacterium]|nr:hypothetical protein [Candidatus Dadabacteria bacterium]NIQ14049.1 hypothetical protein [Candidatus Dadabacteria bacterium]